jgi:hypothetical protein
MKHDVVTGQITSECILLQVNHINGSLSVLGAENHIYHMAFPLHPHPTLQSMTVVYCRLTIGTQSMHPSPLVLQFSLTLAVGPAMLMGDVTPRLARWELP